MQTDLDSIKISDSTIKALAAFKFTDDLGKPMVWTQGQLVIIDCILQRKSPDGKNRIHVQTTTQYGKSAAVGAGVSIRAPFKHEPFALVAGTAEKARIIMEYVTKYSIENSVIAKMLEVPEGLEKLRQRRSQNRLTYAGGGDVRVFSADSRNKQAQGDALMGFGSANVIEDESALIDDVTNAKVLRMLGGHKDNFLMKIGNPFNRNHFLRSWQSDKYFKIKITWEQAVKEGRLAQEFVDEMKLEPLFDILYQVNFPSEDQIDDRGWMPLLTDKDVETAMVKNITIFGDLRLGNDVAGGGRNYSVTILRGYNAARKLLKENIRNTMSFGSMIRGFAQQLIIKSNSIFIDANGIGRGMYERLSEMMSTENNHVMGVMGGEEPYNKEMFANKRAEMYWMLREWVKRGGQLEEDPDWYQLSKIKYKVDPSGRILIMSKQEMLKNGIDSPDIADALSLTFARPEVTAAKKSALISTEVDDSDIDPFAATADLPD